VTAVVNDLLRVAVEQGLTSAELRASSDARDALASAAGVVEPRVEQWRSLADGLDAAAERAAAAHGGRSGASSCSGCGASIRWASTEAGKAMSLDPLPRPGGNVILVNQGRSRLVAVTVPRSSLPVVGRSAYQSHFVSCPMADQFRRRRSGRRAPGADPCLVCGKPRHRLLVDRGETTHPACHPDGSRS
jgi:hypothetical protein